MKGMTLTC